MKKLFLKGYLFEYDFIWIILSVCRYDPFIFNVIRPAVYGYNTSLKLIYRNINAQKINILFFTVLRKNIFDISVVYRINHFLIVRVATANRSINYSIDFTANYFWIVATHNIPSNFDLSSFLFYYTHTLKSTTPIGNTKYSGGRRSDIITLLIV